MIRTGRRAVLAMIAALAATVASNCALNTEGEGAWTPVQEGGPSAGGFGGAGGTVQPDAKLEAQADVSVEKDALPDKVPPPDVKTDSSCWWGEKECGGKCVKTDDPSVGCGEPGCTACKVDHGTATCSNAACAVKGCDLRWGDCDGQYSNGCERPLNTLTDCGKCGEACAVAHGQGDCSSGACKIAANGCESGWADCDNNAANGCEVSLKTLKDCGKCGQVCDLSPAKATCVTGQCLVDTCPTGFADCDGNAANKCEVDIKTLTDCGACAVPCSFPHATASCQTMTCEFLACVAPWSNCDGNTGNGCETNLNDNKDNCGSCGGKCETTNGTNPSCSVGQCSLTCTSPFANCNGPQPGTIDDGCEINTSNDANHCGSCGGKCETTNGTNPVCANGLCTLTCTSPFADCNGPRPGAVDDGCEINTNTNVAHCGGCTKACSVPSNGYAICAGGNCDFGCNLGFTKCGSQCVNLLTNMDHCGGCSWTCESSNVAVRACVLGKCQPVCQPGRADCNGPQAGNVDDGCEINLAAPATCGTCTKDCTVAGLHLSPATCSSGNCGGTCASGWDDCDGNKGNNGCEADLARPVTCGSCSKNCTAASLHLTSPTCSSGNCGGGCAGGYDDCNGNKGTDGCETSLSAPATCGSCSKDCTAAALHLNGATCSSGNCGGPCATNWGDCDGSKNVNGCEGDLTRTVTCGSCSKDCTAAALHLTGPTCSSGNCGGTCAGGYEDCNGNKGTDGCEADLGSPQTCAACNKDCTAFSMHLSAATCVGGLCGGNCSNGWGDCNGNKATDGCETSTNQPTVCGSCTKDCTAASMHLSSPTCPSGQCGGACAGGWEDCANGKHADGCETDITLVGTCGSCSRDCTAVHLVSPTCNSGKCDGTCEGSWRDCDGLKDNNGCEINIDTNPSHCGACAKQCASGFVCVSGQCSCDADADCNTANGGTCQTGGDPRVCKCGGGPNCGVGQTCVSPGTCG